MLENRTVTMGIKEIKRCEILKMANEKQITQGEGAMRIDVMTLSTLIIQLS